MAHFKADAVYVTNDSPGVDWPNDIITDMVRWHRAVVATAFPALMRTRACCARCWGQKRAQGRRFSAHSILLLASIAPSAAVLQTPVRHGG